MINWDCYDLYLARWSPLFVTYRLMYFAPIRKKKIWSNRMRWDAMTLLMHLTSNVKRFSRFYTLPENTLHHWRSSKNLRPFTYNCNHHSVSVLLKGKKKASSVWKATEDERAQTELKPANQLRAPCPFLCKRKLIISACWNVTHWVNWLNSHPYFIHL